MIRLRQGLWGCMYVITWRSSEASSFSWEFSCTAWSRLSETRFNLSISSWFTFRSKTTCDQSSSSCFCFLIRDRRADSRFDIIRRRFLSFITLTWCSSASSEVQLHVDWGLNSWTGGSWYKLENLLNWYAGVLLWIRPKWEGYWFRSEESRLSSCVNSLGCIFSTGIGKLAGRSFGLVYMGFLRYKKSLMEGERKVKRRGYL